MSNDEIALQLTLKALETDCIPRYKEKASQSMTPGKAANENAKVISDFYLSTLDALNHHGK